MNPFNANYFVGYVNHVSPQYVKVHFPSSTLLNKHIFSGEEFNGGLIGNFVTIEGENLGFIGRIAELDLPEKERLSLSEKAFQSSDFHPTAKVEILLSFDYFDSSNAQKTLSSFPNIGSKVYICPSKFIQKYVINFGEKDKQNGLLINLGHLTSNKDTQVKISQQAMFSRHCAIVGTTGGGKSWTVAKLIEGMIKNHTKTILIDPTGEYSTLTQSSNTDTESAVLGSEASFSYHKLTTEDLFFLVKPSGRIQAPKLQEAIRSLKCVQSNIKNISYFSDFVTERGNLKKDGMDVIKFERFCYEHPELDDNHLNFDIKALERQITYECVYNNGTTYGHQSPNDLSYCVSLITRIGNMRKTKILQSVLGLDKDQERNDLTKIIDDFLMPTQKDKLLLRIGFEKIGFEYQAREIVANAIGTYLLDKSRKNEFRHFPIVLILDEAHQFLNNKVVDEYFETSTLSAFDQIAKECRKYGLFLCIATQMPKDIPIGTLSQMGTFIVHRLINYNDKEAIKQACSSADLDLLSFLPMLGSGEAILTGVDFPMPLILKIDEPEIPPDSKTPVFSNIRSYKEMSGKVL